MTKPAALTLAELNELRAGLLSLSTRWDEVNARCDAAFAAKDYEAAQNAVRDTEALAEEQGAFLAEWSAKLGLERLAGVDPAFVMEIGNAVH
jgi:hypothetical protein